MISRNREIGLLISLCIQQIAVLMRLKYRKGLVMMLTNTFKENVVNHIRLTGLTDHDITFHRENGDCFLVIVSDDTMTTIVRVTELKKEIVCSIVAVSLHSNGVPDSGLEILTAIADAIVKETGKYVRVKKA